MLHSQKKLKLKYKSIPQPTLRSLPLPKKHAPLKDDMTNTIQEKLTQIPHAPGVYQYYNKAEQLLYVGKAKDLFKRVNSYWQARNHTPWTILMVKEVVDIKVIEVATELEALMLENSLIKSLQPIYNIKLKDDKTFPFIRISNDEFPIFTVVRKVKNDKARYVGPYFSSMYLRSMLKLLQELYGIKIAKDRSYEARSSVPNQIGLGARNLDSLDKYHQNVDEAIKFLSMPQPSMERILKSAMESASQKNEFERAVIFRNKLFALQQLRKKQSLFSPGGNNFDYVGIEQVGRLVIAYILFEREGKIVDHKHFLFEVSAEFTKSELTQFVLEYLYINGLHVPHKIVVSCMPTDYKEFADDLRAQLGRKVDIFVPKRGKVKKRLATAVENAQYQLKLEALKKNRREHSQADLANILGLAKIPKRIEAFDISNLGATNIVGASIVFINGQPAKNEYRKYKINTPEGQDDFASMRELVFRRVNNKERPLPDLLLIDGGKGQLSAALDALKLAKLDLPIVSLAKKEELLYLPNQSDPIRLKHDSDALLLLMAIRDEVHRFVLNFHRARRSKNLVK